MNKFISEIITDEFDWLKIVVDLETQLKAIEEATPDTSKLDQVHIQMSFKDFRKFIIGIKKLIDESIPRKGDIS